MKRKFTVHYANKQGNKFGFGYLECNGSKVQGFDIGGLKYEGYVSHISGSYHFNIKVTVPSNTTGELVTGLKIIPMSKEQTTRITFSATPANLNGIGFISAKMLNGPVDIMFKPN